MSAMFLEMPQNYVVMENEEMEYLDGGGWSSSKFWKSLDNLNEILAEFCLKFGSRALEFGGGAIAFNIAWTYWTTVSVIGGEVASVVGTIASALFTPVVGAVVGGLSAAGLITYMGTGVRFQ